MPVFSFPHLNSCFFPHKSPAPSQKEGVILLDQEKSNIQRNLRQFVGEYQSYIDEMDVWIGNVNTKLTNVLEAMNPTRMEWRICGVAAKIAKAADVPIIRSASFTLNCVEDMRLDFYINGMDSRVYQKGVCCVRFYCAKGSKFQFETSVGRINDGTKILDTTASAPGETGEFWMDLYFPEWEKEVTNDVLMINVDILGDLGVALAVVLWVV